MLTPELTPHRISTISIVGCGWLGTPLAVQLLAQGYIVKGTRQTQEQLAELNVLGIQGEQLVLSPELYCPNAANLFATDLVIISIPPRRKKHSAQYHIQQISSLLAAISAAQVKRVLFISSTSVYGNLNREITEADPLCPETESGRALTYIEQQLLTRPGLKATVLRFGGLVGGERKPGRFLSGKQVSGADSPVNLLHRDDCIAIIQRLISRNIWGEQFNACCDQHPSRKQLYTQAAKAMGMAPPQFDNSTASWKLISNQKLKQTLNYQFIYPDPMGFI